MISRFVSEKVWVKDNNVWCIIMRRARSLQLLEWHLRSWTWHMLVVTWAGCDQTFKHRPWTRADQRVWATFACLSPLVKSTGLDRRRWPPSAGSIPRPQRLLSLATASAVIGHQQNCGKTGSGVGISNKGSHLVDSHALWSGFKSWGCQCQLWLATG